MADGVRRIEIPYSPRPQFQAYHDRQQRFAITVAHRRAGKTVAEVNEGGRKLLTVQREFPPPQVAFISPTYRQSKRNAWPYARHYFGVIPGAKFFEAELTVEFPNGGRYMFLGSDNPDGLRGLYLDHASLDEFGDQDPRTWGEVVRPALSDYGGSATFIGSARGRNHFYRLLQDHRDDKDFLVTILRASATGIIDDAELDLARRTMTPEQYEQEYECSFDAAVVGAYYGRLISQAEQDGRVTGVPYDPASLVYTAWDLGIGDSTAIWFAQIVGREIHVIDYYENHGQAIPHYAGLVKSKPYVYAEHFLPHDAEAKELGTGKSIKDALDGLQIGATTIVKRTSVEDGINAVRMILPRCWFDARKTERGLDALKLYRAEFDEKGQTFRDKPVHDWTSHGADAFRYLAMKVDDLRSVKDKPWKQAIGVYA